MTAEIIAVTSADLDAVRRLFRDYEAEIGVDLCFQGFEQELEHLPGAYAPPRGRLLIAKGNGEAIGCVALRPLKTADDICEMKRLYVQPAMRSTGVGRQLVERIAAEARSAGYCVMRLDTLSTMKKAQQMYRRFGFRDIAAYYPNPLPGVTYMELDLTKECLA
jgi:N-acetylglutamate synthase-like GNAT family acetyltransferase